MILYDSSLNPLLYIVLTKWRLCVRNPPPRPVCLVQIDPSDFPVLSLNDQSRIVVVNAKNPE